MLVPDLILVKVRLIVPGSKRACFGERTGGWQLQDPSLNPKAEPSTLGGSRDGAGELGGCGALRKRQRLLLVKDLLEDVLETPVIGLQNGVLGAQVERPLLLDRVLEAAVRKARNGLWGERA